MAKKIDEDLTFEQSMKLLEEKVKALESGELTLDESLENFAIGISLIKNCHQKLNQAEQKIEILLDGLKEVEKGEGR